MAKISEYPALAAIVATAQVPVYDPTDVSVPDKSATLATLAKAASVINDSAITATITVGAEAADVRAITVQLKHAGAVNNARRQMVHVGVFADAAGAALATTGGSTGIAIGADGIILATLVAKKVFLMMSSAAGLISLTWTDTGTEAAFLGVMLPDGRLIMGAAMTNA